MRFRRRKKALSYGLAWCDCGAQMAQDNKNRRWDCSDILLGIAVPSGEPGALMHSDVMPYVFWKVRSDRSGKSPVRREPRSQPEEVENAACEVCGALGPCGFTDEGEPLIHGSKREPAAPRETHRE